MRFEAFPEKFLKEMQMILGPEYDSFLNGFTNTRHYGLRLNRLKITPVEFHAMCSSPLVKVPWIDNAFTYDKNIQMSKNPWYYAGLYYLQEPSAMTPANLLPINPGDYVLDLCAAPGGKATELGAKLSKEGMLLANDISASRAKALLKNLELFGIPNLFVTCETPEKLSGMFPSFFDKILIDAPCSGEGMFRKNPEMMKTWEEYGPDYYSSLQRSIVKQALSMLRPGGMILYSTCTFSPVENEGTVQYMLESDPSLHVEKLPEYEGFSPGRPDLLYGHDEWNFIHTSLIRDEELKNCIRLWPHKLDGEGHFVALLKNTREASPHVDSTIQGRKKNGKAMPGVLSEFLKECHYPIEESRLEIKESRIYLMPEGLHEKKGIRFLRSGLLLGEMTPKGFEPSQALAMVLTMEQFDYPLNLNSSDERLIRYLKGETIDLEPDSLPRNKGYVLVCVDGYPLGWGKIINGTLRNKYLPGWRWQS